MDTEGLLLKEEVRAAEIGREQDPPLPELSARAQGYGENQALTEGVVQDFFYRVRGSCHKTVFGPLAHCGVPATETEHKGTEVYGCLKVIRIDEKQECSGHSRPDYCNLP